ncbi:MAG: dTMP kinase [Pseudomonadota bacterium]
MEAKFIVIEGLEGAGKSTVISSISDYLRARSFQCIVTREPGGTPMAEAIRDCVKQDWQETVTEQTELLLMYAARSQLVSNVILPSLQNNVWVIGDRHDLSTVAYQGGGRGIAVAQLDMLKQLTLGDFAPDYTLYLDIDPAKGLERARGRGQLDRIEQAGLAFFERARDMYLSKISGMENACCIDASASKEVVEQHAVQALSAWMDTI